MFYASWLSTNNGFETDRAAGTAGMKRDKSILFPVSPTSSRINQEELGGAHGVCFMGL